MVNTKGKQFNPAISLVKVIAMFLIIHSHSDILFPDRLSFLATGGALGNELFFLVGGYLYSTNKPIKATTYNRFIRLYIPTYIMTIVLYIFRIISIKDLKSLREIIYRLVWPTSFWFVSAIFFSGILFHTLYLLGCFDSKKNIIVFMLVYILGNTVLYILGVPDKNKWVIEDYKFFGGMFYYKCVYSFAVFCLGHIIKKFIWSRKMDERLLFIGAVLSFIAFYAFKYCLNRNIVPMRFQIFGQPITVLCVLFIMIWIIRSDTINIWINNSPKKAAIINGLGLITLEAFLVQFEIVSVINRCKILFPLNYFINLIIILIASYAFHKVDDYVCSKMIR